MCPNPSESWKQAGGTNKLLDCSPEPCSIEPMASETCPSCNTPLDQHPSIEETCRSLQNLKNMQRKGGRSKSPRKVKAVCNNLKRAWEANRKK